MKCDELENKEFDGGRTAYELMEANGLLNTTKIVKEAIAQLKQQLHDAEMRADLAEAAETERRIDYRHLQRTLWLARAKTAVSEAKYNFQTARRYEEHKEHTIARCLDAEVHKWKNVERKCLKKAEQYR